MSYPEDDPLYRAGAPRRSAQATELHERSWTEGAFIPELKERRSIDRVEIVVAMLGGVLVALQLLNLAVASMILLEVHL